MSNRRGKVRIACLGCRWRRRVGDVVTKFSLKRAAALSDRRQLLSSGFVPGFASSMRAFQLASAWSAPDACTAAQDAMELKAPPSQAPASIQDVTFSESNRSVVRSLSSYPPWDAYKAPWPNQVRGRWFQGDIFHKLRFEVTEEEVDLRNMDMMFWSRAAPCIHHLAASIFQRCVALSDVSFGQLDVICCPILQHASSAKLGSLGQASQVFRCRGVVGAWVSTLLCPLRPGMTIVSTVGG